MPSSTIDTLKQKIIVAASRSEAPSFPEIRSRPVFIMAPLSYLGCMHAAAVVAALPQVVAAVDDTDRSESIHGVPRWTMAEFIERASDFPGAIAIDFSVQRGTRALIADVCRLAGVKLLDCIMALAETERHSVYESVPVYRDKTLERLDDFMRLAERFSDDYSRETLYANLLFRLTYDRSSLMATWTNSEAEYFSIYGNADTFKVGSREHFCDCGAFQGPIVKKFLAASDRRYQSITAFEPDRENFKILQSSVSPVPLRGFQAIDKAVSDSKGVLRFHETGTMSSHVSESGSVEVSTTTLDDELEHMTLLKMDVEGSEAAALRGARRLLSTQRPRVAACVYHYAQDLLDVVQAIDEAAPNYHFRLRHHFGAYYYDLMLYASPILGTAPGLSAV